MKSSFKTPENELSVGTIPRVVGTLLSLPSPLGTVPCDVVEIRADHVMDQDWLACGKKIEADGTPVILTVRLHAEGGKWDGPDANRFELYQKALGSLSAVDVELRSNICEQVAAEAKAQGKLCIVSYHDFFHTPPLDTLEKVVMQAQEIGGIVKVVTLTESLGDVEILEDLLQKPWKVPLCVMGMGSLGTETRSVFPKLGSALTYGYLDKPAAPGQLAAADLVEKLRNTIPGYDADFRARMEETD